MLPPRPGKLFLYMYVPRKRCFPRRSKHAVDRYPISAPFENRGAERRADRRHREVSNSCDAMKCWPRAASTPCPCRCRLIREMHAPSWQKRSRRDQRRRVSFRRTQNWIGGKPSANRPLRATPSERVESCLDRWERFFSRREPSRLPALIRRSDPCSVRDCSTPSSMGNGRKSAIARNALPLPSMAFAKPMLYLSLYLKTHRTMILPASADVREKGDLGRPGWTSFSPALRNSKPGLRRGHRNRGLVQSRMRERASTRNSARSRFQPCRVHDWFRTSTLPSLDVGAAGGRTRAPDRPDRERRSLADSEEAVPRHHRGVYGSKAGRVFRSTATWEILNEGTDPVGQAAMTMP